MNTIKLVEVIAKSISQRQREINPDISKNLGLYLSESSPPRGLEITVKIEKTALRTPDNMALRWNIDEEPTRTGIRLPKVTNAPDDSTQERDKMNKISFWFIPDFLLLLIWCRFVSSANAINKIKKTSVITIKKRNAAATEWKNWATAGKKTAPMAFPTVPTPTIPKILPCSFSEK